MWTVVVLFFILFVVDPIFNVLWDAWKISKAQKREEAEAIAKMQPPTGPAFGRGDLHIEAMKELEELKRAGKC